MVALRPKCVQSRHLDMLGNVIIVAIEISKQSNTNYDISIASPKCACDCGQSPGDPSVQMIPIMGNLMEK